MYDFVNCICQASTSSSQKWPQCRVHLETARQVVWGWGVGVRKVGRVQLGSAAAAAWARAQRTGAVCGCGQCRPTYKVQLALGGGGEGEGVLWSAEGGCTLHLLDYCGADAEPGCLRRARRDQHHVNKPQAKKMLETPPKSWEPLTYLTQWVYIPKRFLSRIPQPFL